MYGLFKGQGLQKDNSPIGDSLMHSGVYKGTYYNVSLRELTQYTLEGFYDAITGQKSEYISPDRYIWLEKGGIMKIPAQDSPDLEGLFDD